MRGCRGSAAARGLSLRVHGDKRPKQMPLWYSVYIIPVRQSPAFSAPKWPQWPENRLCSAIGNAGQSLPNVHGEASRPQAGTKPPTPTEGLKNPGSNRLELRCSRIRVPSEAVEPAVLDRAEGAILPPIARERQ